MFNELLAYYQRTRPPKYLAILFVGGSMLILTPLVVFAFGISSFWNNPSNPKLSNILIAVAIISFLAGGFGNGALWIVKTLQRRIPDPFAVGGMSRDRRIERMLNFLSGSLNVGTGRPGLTRQSVEDGAVVTLIEYGIAASKRIHGHKALDSSLAAHVPPIRDGFPLVFQAAEDAFQLCAIVEKAAAHNKDHAKARLGEPMADIWRRVDALSTYADSLDALIEVQDRVQAIGERDALDDQIDQLTGTVRGQADVRAIGGSGGELQDRVRALNQAADDLATLMGKPDLSQG